MQPCRRYGEMAGMAIYGAAGLPLGRRYLHAMVAYLKAGSSLDTPSYQPFRRTYGTAVWLATPIMPLRGKAAQTLGQDAYKVAPGEGSGCA